MKNTKLKHSIMHLCKWTSFVMLAGCSVSGFAASNSKEITKALKLDSISGIIYDAVSKTALAGAQITTSDPKYTAMTDENGAFTVKFPSYIKTLTILAPDFNKKEVPIFISKTPKLIYLYPAVYDNYFQDQLTVTGIKTNISVVNTQKTINFDNLSSISIDNELKNKLASEIKLTNYSGTPAAGASMLIRGINSLNAKVQPLIVVDGVILDNQEDKTSIHEGNIMNTISNIDVNDIQSVSVLKDGTSLYGSKGGNGVILISTNRGRGVATKITASSMIGYTMKPNITPMMNSDQYRVYLSGLLMDETAQEKISNQFFLQEDKNFIYYNRYHNNTNWSDGVYNNSATQSYSVAVNGGDEIALYNLSIGITNALSTLKSNDFNRLNARFNSDIKLNDKFSTSFDISYIQTKRELRNDGIAESFTSQINSPGYLSLIKSPFLSPYQYDNTGMPTKKLEDYDFVNIANPYAILEYGVGQSQKNLFNLAIQPSYKFNKSLKISSRLSYSMNNTSENSFSPMYGVAPLIDITHEFKSLNYVKTQFVKQISLFSDTRVNWVKSKGCNSFELNAGVRYLNDAFESEYALGHNTGSDQVKEMSNSLAYKSVGGVDDPAKLLTYYGVFNYSLKNKYFVEATLNTETNSRFGSDAKDGFKFMGVSWATFPSLNAAWVISSEKIMKSVKFVDVLKLRAGYGISGNDGIQSSATKTYMNAVRYSKSATGLQLYNISNAELQWETVTKRSLGLDADLFNEHVLLSVDLYHNTSDNLLVQKNLNPISGFGTYWSNDGKLQNKGYEVSLNVKVLNYKNLKLTLGASVAHYANKILALADGDYKTSVYGGEILTAVGQPIGQFYGYKTAGVYSTTAEANADGLSMKKSTGELVPFAAGDVRFINNDASDKLIDEKDKVVIGNSNPDLYGAFNAGIRFKRLNVQLVFNYSYGNDIYNYLRSQLESGSTFNNQSVAMTNRWFTEGQKTTIPNSVYDDPKGNNRFSDRWIEDGSYLRLKTLEVSYELPIKVSFLQNVTIWASANNLWTLTKYLGVDPEFSAGNQMLYQSIDTGLLPQSKSYFAGIKIYL